MGSLASAVQSKYASNSGFFNFGANLINSFNLFGTYESSAGLEFLLNFHIYDDTIFVAFGSWIILTILMLNIISHKFES